jgi:regulator of replication initiation timing
VSAAEALLGADGIGRLVVQVQGLARELIQSQRDCDRIARENVLLCDEVHALREENEGLREELTLWRSGR